MGERMKLSRIEFRELQIGKNNKLPSDPWKGKMNGERFDLPLHPSQSLQHLNRYGNSWDVASINKM